MHPLLTKFRQTVLEPRFNLVHFAKPKASRSESSEGYLVCQGWKRSPGVRRNSRSYTRAALSSSYRPDGAPFPVYHHEQVDTPLSWTIGWLDRYLRGTPEGILYSPGTALTVRTHGCACFLTAP